MNQTNRTNRSRRIFAAAVALGWVLVTVTQAGAQTIASPPTPTLITPPVGNVAFLVGHAVGTQGYVCLPKGTGASWTVNNARPRSYSFREPLRPGRPDHHPLLSPDTNPNKDAPIHYPSAVRRGRVPDSSKVWAQVLNGNVNPRRLRPELPE